MDSFFDGIRRTGIARSDERWIGGVSGGLARRMNIDPLIVRGLFAVSVLLGGLGLVLYGVGWLLLPEERDGRIHFQQLIRGDFDAAVIGGFGLMLVGFAFPNRWAPFMWWAGDTGAWRGLVGLIAVVVIIAVIASAAGRKPAAPYVAPPAPYVAPPAPYASAPAAAAAPNRSEGPTMYTAPPQYAPAPAPALRPAPTLPRPPRKGPGATAVGVVFALSLLTLAGLLYAERLGYFTGSVLLTAGAVAVILSGLGIVAAGLLGRTSGGLGALAIVSVIVLVPLAAIDGINWNSATVGVGEVRSTPTTVQAAENGLSLGAGEAIVDLTEVPLDGEVVEVPIHVGTGEVRVIVPEDGAYAASIRVMAGEIRWTDASSTSRVGSTWQDFESEAVRDGAAPELDLRISVGAGTVTVVEASR
jgi:phage shock protein PspC (stress-responsive transcriptional regulator)